MESTHQISKGRLWTSYILQGLVALVFLMGAVTNLLQTDTAVNGAVEMGYSKSSILYLGVLLLVSSVLYAIPNTTFLGASLLTAWLGGAVATHVIHSDPITIIAIPVVFGILVWLSIWLRNEKLRQLISFGK